MKRKTTFFIIMLSFVILTFCKKEDSIHDINNIENNQFLVGVALSQHYIDFNPDLKVIFLQNANGYYSFLDSIDYNSDSNFDFFFKFEGFADGFYSGITNYFEYKLINYKGLEFVSDSNNLLKPKYLNDTLNSNLNWKNSNEFLMVYSSPYDLSGNWVGLQNDCYIGFRRFVANDTIMGWFRICAYSSTDGSGYIIKDCGLDK